MVGPPSFAQSALRVALRRAAHQIVDRPVVFDDPIAVRLLNPEYSEALARTPVFRSTGRDRSWSRSLRAVAVARSLYAEEQLQAAVARGLRHYCLPGAGLDTFAWRNPYPELQVWEVDRPEVLAWKRDLAERAGLPYPSRCVRIAADLATAALPRSAPRGEPTLFALLGVAPYLEAQVLRRWMDLVREQGPGSGLVFDFRLPRALLGPEEQRQHDSLAARLAAAGEPLRPGCTPHRLASALAGFTRVEDLGAEQMNRRYFNRREDGLAVRGEAVRLVSAWL